MPIKSSFHTKGVWVPGRLGIVQLSVADERYIRRGRACRAFHTSIAPVGRGCLLPSEAPLNRVKKVRSGVLADTEYNDITISDAVGILNIVLNR